MEGNWDTSQQTNMEKTLRSRTLWCRIQSALWGQGFVRGPPLPRRKKSAPWKEGVLPEEARQISHLAAAHELLTAREAAASLIQGQKLMCHQLLGLEMSCDGTGPQLGEPDDRKGHEGNPDPGTGAGPVRRRTPHDRRRHADAPSPVGMAPRWARVECTVESSAALNNFLTRPYRVQLLAHPCVPGDTYENVDWLCALILWMGFLYCVG